MSEGRLQGTVTPDKAPPPPAAGPLLQRQCACGNHAPGGGECESCRKQKQLQRKAASKSGAGVAPDLVHEVLRSVGHPLDPGTRAFLEPRFGQDFSGVRVHTDARAAESARRVNALAYTVGQDLVFAKGRYAPGTSAGVRLLAHELAHSIQQKAFSGPQAKLEIDDASSPLEAAADRAADAALRGHPVPALGAFGPTLSRQVADTRSLPEERGECKPNPVLGTDILHYTLPTADAPTGKYTISSVESVSDNEKRVRISTGKSYLVRRNPWTTTDEVPATSGSAKPGLDKQQVWLDIELCRGNTEGTIRVGANVPDQVIQLILNTLTSGGDVDAAWKKASITPSVSGTLKIGHWSVDLSAHTTVDTKGKDTGASGEVSVSTDVAGGRATVGVSGESQNVGGKPFGGAQVQPFFRFEWGKSQTPPKCTTQRIRSGFTYECREEREVSKPGTQSVTHADERDYNLFFNYAVPEFNEPKNSQSWKDLASDLAAGYQVARIAGYASPEGPMGPGKGGFVGNDVLSQQRADAVQKRIAALCKGGACFLPGASVVGLGERMDPKDETGTPQDVSGKPLEEHVDQTFPTDPGEASVRTPALTKSLNQTPSLHARAEKIYPELRRAIVTLRKSSTGSDKCTFKVPEEAYLSECPEDIRQAAFPDNPSTP
ncbi:MAG TPA: DUF4157 domain-containing protein [Geothrix sp.]|nr:DUF4157 domain-containing protein [Geothrix sp.]